MLTIGCDPEVFLRKDNRIISGIGLIGGTKQKPIPVKDGALQEDNVTAEINIRPANSAGLFASRLNKVMDALRERTKCDLEIKPSHVFDRAYLKSLGSKAFTLGCEPDYNIYTGKENPRPNPYTCLRTAGGHVHVGCLGIDLTRLVKTMDLYLGIPSVLKDSDKERRSMYGKAGSYRPKSYGLEYRTLSNFWLQSDELMQWVYETTEKAVKDHNTVDLLDDDTVQHIINFSDVGLARDVCQEYGLVDL